MSKIRVLQPQYFEHFRCIGADCEDTCCDGWGIIVDRETYEKYQDPLAGQIEGEALSGLVEINPAGNSSRDYAKMRLVGTRCCALREGMCSIQQTLGESNISDLCSSFPRVLNVTGGVVERSLHVSCPEAARLALTDPDAMAFQERMEEDLPHRPGSLSLVGDAPDEGLSEARGLMIQVIRERSRPLWQRIASLGFAIDELVRTPAKPASTILEKHLIQLKQGAFDGILSKQAISPGAQIEAVVELIVTQFGLEYTAPRFVECYGEFMRGLGWTAESTIEDLAGRYQHAMQSYYLPFVQRQEYFFENYLTNYMFKTLFPYGRKQADTGLVIDRSEGSIRDAYLLFAAHYAIIRTVLIGMAALHEQKLNIDHALKLVQSCSKAFQHSSSFSGVMLKFLKQETAPGIAALIVD